MLTDSTLPTPEGGGGGGGTNSLTSLCLLICISCCSCLSLNFSSAQATFESKCNLSRLESEVSDLGSWFRSIQHSDWHLDWDAGLELCSEVRGQIDTPYNWQHAHHRWTEAALHSLPYLWCHKLATSNTTDLRERRGGKMGGMIPPIISPTTTTNHVPLFLPAAVTIWRPAS